MKNIHAIRGQNEHIWLYTPRFNLIQKSKITIFPFSVTAISSLLTKIQLNNNNHSLLKPQHSELLCSSSHHQQSHTLIVANQNSAKQNLNYNNHVDFKPQQSESRFSPFSSSTISSLNRNSAKKNRVTYYWATVITLPFKPRHSDGRS